MAMKIFDLFLIFVYVFLSDESLFTCPPHNILKYINSTFCIAMMLLNVDEQVGDILSRYHVRNNKMTVKKFPIEIIM